ncbi:hypothetical protein R1sor_003227 [Riccia sorocarpa]|uniref:Integrase catalytic domain-containing protein n=1 Tax=Riccia sorocarpa TaxID=122646 RepID=A0ABD3H4D1_9MARC
MEVAAYKKDGSNRHIKGCERATESLKFEIRGLNARHRGRMVEQNNSANEPSSSGNVRLTEEDHEIEQAFPGSILGDSAGTPSSCFHNTANNVRAQHSNFSSPSSIANDSVHSSSQPLESLPPRTQPYIRRTVQLPLKHMMDAAQREKADRLWAMAQQVAGLPFRVFSHPAFQEAYNFSSQFPGYKFPREKKLRGPLLDVNYQAVKEETEKKMFQKLIWDKITISCGGWTNVSGRPKMNILDVNRFDEAVHCHVDGSNEVKSGVWIAGHIKKAIEERGPENVLQFVADNASANTLAGKLVRDTYPHVIFGGCVAHGLDLLMEDIGKLDWVKSVVTDCKTFIQFVKNHHMPHAMFLDHFSNGATLLKPAATRFATNCIMLDRAYTFKGPLSRMVISDRWRNWVSDPLRPANVREGAEHLKTMVLDDEFWDKVHDIVFMMERIFILLRQVDAHKDFMGRIYWESWETQDALKHLYTASVLKSNILTAASCDQVMLLFRHRWNGWTNCIHTTTMLLNPAYLWDEDRQEVSHHNFIMEDFHEYVKLFATGVLKITGEELRQYLRSVDRELDGIACMDTSIWTQEHREKALSEECRTAPMLWWAQAGRNAPLLRVIAMNILGLTLELAEAYGIEHRRSTPYHPQTNGQVERTNGILVNVMKKTVALNPISLTVAWCWCLELSVVLWRIAVVSLRRSCTNGVDLSHLCNLGL